MYYRLLDVMLSRPDLNLESSKYIELGEWVLSPHQIVLRVAFVLTPTYILESSLGRGCPN